MVRSCTIVLALTLAATSFAAPLPLERRTTPMEEDEQLAMRSFIGTHPFLTAVGSYFLAKTMGGNNKDGAAQERDLQDDDEQLLEMRDMDDNTPWVVLRDANMEYVASMVRFGDVL
ncbi:hypothetical protein DACRYDRAFT_108961 [Dacryopinax primogenitus]|uniref:Uncharacterized protein n=1 Tax=Dacryopinax primogenitus (strain DJM 731) TaxID=1858805 RepID=M5FVC0_DACPD|nr:uncharacterized protein DACRYDRAFT_108961 [Dacryopinax primogenitus]EJU00214.1 hypothetical protein DACRYDRAFT_108961 [Dacryopinax primogenitus]